MRLIARYSLRISYSGAFRFRSDLVDVLRLILALYCCELIVVEAHAWKSSFFSVFSAANLSVANHENAYYEVFHDCIEQLVA